MASQNMLPMRSSQPLYSKRLQVPGFGLPIQYLLDKDKRHQHAIADRSNITPITERELRMLQFVNQITDKPSWETKVYDEAIVRKWKEEGSTEIGIGEPAISDVILSEQMFDFCIQELRAKAKLVKSGEIFTRVFDIDDTCTIAKSDAAVPCSIKSALQKLVKPLEDINEKYKDWHPGSDNKVLDLIHPSLNPIIYGTTKAIATEIVPLKNCIDKYACAGELTLPAPTEEDSVFERPPGDGFFNKSSVPHAWGSYQWMPSDVKFEAGKAKITSYINNLHAEYHEDLYHVFEDLLDVTIPLWNAVLATYSKRERIPVSSTSQEDFELMPGRLYPYERTPDGIRVPNNAVAAARAAAQRRRDAGEVVEVDEEEEENEEDDGEEDDDEEDEGDDEEYLYDNDYLEWVRENSNLNWPEPKSYKSYIENLTHEPEDLESYPNGLQVIFKMANIHLTPDSPTYDGGSWHIEGALNDHICATAIYYYDSTNITPSSLSFRHHLDTWDLTMKPMQNEPESLEYFYGIQNDGSNEQDIGSVLTPPGRLLCFPNTVQHCVEPFELLDKSREGYRKIVAMFLVDPNIRVLSSANVGPQRRDWWAERVRLVPAFASLPLEIFERVVGFVDGMPLGREKAEEVREALMEERGMVDDEAAEAFQGSAMGSG
ncbi:hypothetical protein BT63DRAFT_410152 [Microthyrium microscopicum]|uniref:Uncharacterized protein n=1 Tax=Microthyrium microscopicum TaxID=703497 RepID=A0A6A6ULD9_9PEZI|nr:hypothetical protein BT63DRAFT_410152 [Microthyrium microscopicum]